MDSTTALWYTEGTGFGSITHALASGEHSLLAKLNEDRTSVEFRVDGAVIAVRALTNSATKTIIRVECSGSFAAASAGELRYFRVDSIPPPPPPVFWQNFNRTHEVP